MTSIFSQMEDDLNFFKNGRQPQFLKIEEDLNFFKNERQPQYFKNGRRPELFFKWKTT
jgi:hypothetical protein